MVLAVIIGYFVSRSLTKPIQCITRTASQIRNGDLTARTGVRGTDEIGQLGETFDDMATSLEKDLKLEHRLTSDVAHELRTPLMAILATVEAMQDGVLPADDEHLETLASETRRLSRLVDAMLKLSRLENGTTELKVERTDVVYLVRSLVSSQHQLFHEKGLHLRFKDDTAHGECQADIDPDLIREAVVNLMSNAMRYTDEDGWVVVSVGSDHSDAIISVRDTGIGIAKEDIPQTFSRFWRSDVSGSLAAWVWASPSPRRLWTGTTAPSRSTPSWARVLRSPSACHSTAGAATSSRLCRRSSRRSRGTATRLP